MSGETAAVGVVDRVLLKAPGEFGVKLRATRETARRIGFFARAAGQRLAAQAMPAERDAFRGAAMVQPPRRDVMLIHGARENIEASSERIGEPVTWASIMHELRLQGARVQSTAVENLAFDGHTLLVDGKPRELPDAIMLRTITGARDGGANPNLVRLEQAGVHMTNRASTLKYSNKAEMARLFGDYGVETKVVSTRDAGWDNAGVDIIKTRDGWKVIEINNSPGIIEFASPVPRPQQMIPNWVRYTLFGQGRS
jgi:hypothetical protein